MEQEEASAVPKKSSKKGGPTVKFNRPTTLTPRKKALGASSMPMSETKKKRLEWCIRNQYNPTTKKLKTKASDPEEGEDSR